MKANFDVEDQGFEALDEEQSNNLIRDCIEYIKTAKVRICSAEQKFQFLGCKY